ncbi:MAG: hypothetical protein KJ990_06795 [Proteobacteria bacterium]|nr:hypothetical protein [Pseudomonadota bacterium]MBU1649032.1 hypothetical protein [Pseudomonadota bacterium]
MTLKSANAGLDFSFRIIQHYADISNLATFGDDCPTKKPVEYSTLGKKGSVPMIGIYQINLFTKRTYYA